MYKQRSTKHYTENEKHELHYLSLGWAQVLRNKICLHQAQFFFMSACDKVGVQKGGVQKNQLSTKQIYINETTQKLKHLQIVHAREVLYVVN
jgi:hypothetical protein